MRKSSKTLVIGVPAETRSGEKRIALSPEDAARLGQSGFQVVLEKGAGVAAGFPDEDYKAAQGVKIGTKAAAWGADLVVHVQPPSTKEVGLMKKKSALVSHIFAASHAAEIKALAARGINCLAMELIPRITRAQAMDSLSSQATVSGYWGALHAAASSPVFLPMITYAAGTIRPAKILVIGAGVAGLQAIATARRLGAIVEAFDVRPETREQIASLGAKPVDLGFDASGEGGYARELTKEEQQKVAEALSRTLTKSDIVITTAGVPGRPSPKIISRAQVEGMRSGSLIVDLVAESGGNCELTKPGTEVIHKGVTISGPTNIPSNMPYHASQMYSKNLMGMLGLVVQNGQVVIENNNDEVIKGCTLLQSGKAVHPSLADARNVKQTPEKKTPAKTKAAGGTKKSMSAKAGAGAASGAKAKPTAARSKNKPAAPAAKAKTSTSRTKPKTTLKKKPAAKTTTVNKPSARTTATTTTTKKPQAQATHVATAKNTKPKSVVASNPKTKARLVMKPISRN